MKNIGRIAFTMLLIIGIIYGYFSYKKINTLEQEILNLTTETTVIENIGNLTCVGSGVNGEIKGHATCTYLGDNSQDARIYSGDFYNHNINGYGVFGVVQEGCFYNGIFKIGKAIDKMGFFDDEGNLNYGMKAYVGGYDVGNFVGGVLFDGYSIISDDFSKNFGCKKYKDGIPTDITKTVTNTVTNTVYRNSNIKINSPLGDLYKPGSKYNPYQVQLELK